MDRVTFNSGRPAHPTSPSESQCRPNFLAGPCSTHWTGSLRSLASAARLDASSRDRCLQLQADRDRYPEQAALFPYSEWTELSRYSVGLRRSSASAGQDSSNLGCAPSAESTPQTAPCTTPCLGHPRTETTRALQHLVLDRIISTDITSAGSSPTESSQQLPCHVQDALSSDPGDSGDRS